MQSDRRDRAAGLLGHGAGPTGREGKTAMDSRRAAALLALLAGAACAHAPRGEIVRPVAAVRCDEALETLRLHPTPPPPADGLRQVVTTPLSWAAIGAGYTVDVAALGVLAGGASVTLCLPLLLLEASVGGRGELSAECVKGVATAVVEAVPLPGLGHGLRSATRSWRCPDLERRAAEARAVAGCFAGRGGPGDREAAEALLRPLTAREVDRCVPPRHREEVRRALEELTPPAAAPPPSEAPTLTL